MNLTDEILLGTYEGVEALIQQGADVNELDLFGYTPLIEAAIADRFDIGKLLIENGAKVMDRDFVGGSALHWAVENNNIEFSECLLKNGADPNAHTLHGTPVLMNPVLRRHDQLKKLLYKYGGALKFAKDYINTKLLGHRFELLGQGHIVNAHGKFILIDFEGFYLEFSVAIIMDSLYRYRRNFAAKHLRIFFRNIQKITKSLSIASELIRYQQYMVDVKKHVERIDVLMNNDLLMIPTAYMGHAITFVTYGSLFAKCDRGENSKFEGPVVIYEITKPHALTNELLKAIIYEEMTDHFMHSEINEILGLKPVMNLPLAPQESGNCSWANVEASIPTMLFLLLLGEGIDVEMAKDQAMLFFHEWREWDKDRALDECVQEIKYVNKARKASKVAILGSILFQQCDYMDERDLKRAEKIMSVLGRKAYTCILNSFKKTYVEENKTAGGKNLEHLLESVYY